MADWLERLRAVEVPTAPVNNLDGAFVEPPVAEREMIVEYNHPEVGKVCLPGNPIKVSGVGVTISKPARILGEHSDEMLGKILNRTAEQIACLLRERVLK